jgi:FMN reductase
MRIALVIGQATAPGRLVTACRALEQDLRDAGAEVEVVDLAATPVQICDGRPFEQYEPATRGAVGAINSADAAALASPVYRASFSGVLKNFLDLLPLEALRGKPVAILAMGATDHHYLGVDTHLRAVLAWFGALAMPTSVYLAGRDFDQSKLTERARGELHSLAATLAMVTGRTSGAALGPDPLAGRG